MGGTSQLFNVMIRFLVDNGELLDEKANEPRCNTQEKLEIRNDLVPVQSRKRAKSGRVVMYTPTSVSPYDSRNASVSLETEGSD